MKIRFITGNPGKVQEMEAALAPLGHEVIQDDRGYPEVQADTLQEVAEAGARHLLAAGVEPPFMLEDAGLFVHALKGFPGVYSSYALDTIGCQGILDLLTGAEAEMRTAHFEAYLQYVDADGALHAFSGRVDGAIATTPAGAEGFGFDPIFVPDERPEGRTDTFAEMSAQEKNRISHRGKAANGLLKWLKNQ